MAASGANKKAAAAAQRFLVRQAWGPRRGRFAVQRTLEHLKKGNVVFNETVKAIKLNIPGTHDHCARRFLYENVPQLKFKNPHVMITRTKDASREANIQVVFGDGKRVDIPTLDKTPSQLLDEVARLTSLTRRESISGNTSSAGKEER